MRQQKSAPATKRRLSPPRGAQRPGGRTEKIRRAVAQAVLTLIKKGKLDFRLQEVSRLAGVHRTTIYQRWPSRAALLIEALSEHTSHFDVKLSGNWRRDLKKIGVA